MVDFSSYRPRIVCGNHAAERWIERVGFSGTLAEAKSAIESGIRENGHLVLTNNHPVDGFTYYYQWMCLIFPLIPKWNTFYEEDIWLVKTTLLWGMPGFEKTQRGICR